MSSDAALFVSAALNESLLDFNTTFGSNGSSLSGNGTALNGTQTDGVAEDELTGVIITAVTSIILGLMILITVIGGHQNR